jgi:hypothetical protein
MAGPFLISESDPVAVPNLGTFHTIRDSNIQKESTLHLGKLARYPRPPPCDADPRASSPSPPWWPLGRARSADSLDTISHHVPFLSRLNRCSFMYLFAMEELARAAIHRHDDNLKLENRGDRLSITSNSDYRCLRREKGEDMQAPLVWQHEHKAGSASVFCSEPACRPVS